MKLLALAVAASGLLAACHEPTGPTPPPDLLLTGTWWFTFGRTPGGSGIELNLRTTGTRIAGRGTYWCLACDDDSFVVDGNYSDASRSFAFTIRYSSGPEASYAGQVFGADSLVGTWTGSDGASISPRTFYREPEPPCSDSAPLLGTYDPVAPGFIVRFQDSVNATAEAGRLAARYGFTTTLVYEAALKGFAADLSPATAAVLRCEPKVMNVEYNAVFGID